MTRGTHEWARLGQKEKGAPIFNVLSQVGHRDLTMMQHRCLWDEVKGWRFLWYLVVIPGSLCLRVGKVRGFLHSLNETMTYTMLFGGTKYILCLQFESA